MEGALKQGAGLDRTGRGLRWAMGGGIVSGLALLFLLAPGALGYACPFHALTGHSCFACGLTRSLHAALHGDLVQSFRFHPVGPLLLAALAAAGLRFLVEAATGKKVAVGVMPVRITLLALAGIWVVFGAARLALEFF